MKRQPHLVPIAVIILVVTACLAPFLDKAYHIDDPLFLWTARYIQEHPFDFYGFGINWYGTEMPMYEVTKNPPLASYYIALVASVAGWSERVLHAAFLLPAVAAAVGTYVLAIELCSMPLLATLAAVATPGFLLSSTSVMCDTMMLAFWVWASAFWIRGMNGNSTLSLIIAAVLVSLAALTKYFGLCLIPLLFAYGLAKERTIGRWALVLLIPVAVLLVYQAATAAMYGQGLLLSAFSYPQEYRDAVPRQFWLRTMTGLSFAGGCLLTALTLSPLLWKQRGIMIGLLTAALSAGILFALNIAGVAGWPGAVQFALFSFAGGSILALAAADLRTHRDPSSLFLFLWVAGTFLFATYLNWTMNGRSILPLAPAAGILIARRLEDRGMTGRFSGLPGETIAPLLLSLGVALMVCWADYRFADNARAEAAEVPRFAAGRMTGSLWFQGHWGFQFYLESMGGRAFDARSTRLQPGDVVVVPSNNTNLLPMPDHEFAPARISKVRTVPYLAVMHKGAGAGYYSDQGGPLPYAFGSVPVDEYAYLEVIK